ncbi:hypothetical protein M0811_12002 [Anaeramoeba ignava]|uniref:Uncharacterized protein n=1 Tax=Anaeramoeba ignava TaxID=1746090 RepID=A0A9Q0LAN1_ANAIG|nr:hypothetical protein M0811_12002 [Anaeramoeba ignava]
MTTQKHKSKWKERRRLNKIKEEHIDVLQKKQITRKEIRKEINQTVFETFKILQEYCFMKEKNGAKHLQQTLIYLH